jgi:hypothetical protein
MKRRVLTIVLAVALAVLGQLPCWCTSIARTPARSPDSKR